MVRHRVTLSCLTAGNIASMDTKALPGNDSRYVQLKLSVKEVPDILLDHFDAQDRYVFNHLCFAPYMLCGVLRLPPGLKLIV